MSRLKQGSSESGGQGQQVFVGRQAIFDRALRVDAYELLFRASDAAGASFEDGEIATAEVITTAFMDIGLERLVGDNRAFINVTRDFLIDQRAMSLPPERVVLEILEDVQIDAKLVDSVRQHSDDGFTIALDDFCFDESWRPLVEICDIIKIDVMALGLDGTQAHVDLLIPHGKQLLAEKVETKAEYDALRTMGFSLFQGFFLSRPNVMAGRRLASGKLTQLRLLAALQSSETSRQEIENLVVQDVGLSYKLLRFINSAFFSLRQKIDSIQRAVVYLGIEPLKRWGSLMVLAGMDDKPGELVRNAMVRASMCERLATKLRATPAAASAAFTVGLLSTLDVLMDQSLEDVVAELPLDAELHGALLERSGVLGALLDCVVAYERCDWARAQVDGLTTAQLRDAYVDAVEWATQAAASAGIGA